MNLLFGRPHYFSSKKQYLGRPRCILAAIPLCQEGTRAPPAALAPSASLWWARPGSCRPARADASPPTSPRGCPSSPDPRCSCLLRLQGSSRSPGSPASAPQHHPCCSYTSARPAGHRPTPHSGPTSARRPGGSRPPSRRHRAADLDHCESIWTRRPRRPRGRER